MAYYLQPNSQLNLAGAPWRVEYSFTSLYKPSDETEPVLFAPSFVLEDSELIGVVISNDKLHQRSLMESTPGSVFELWVSNRTAVLTNDVPTSYDYVPFVEGARVYFDKNSSADFDDHRLSISRYSLVEVDGSYENIFLGNILNWPGYTDLPEGSSGSQISRLLAVQLR